MQKEKYFKNSDAKQRKYRPQNNEEALCDSMILYIMTKTTTV